MILHIYFPSLSHTTFHNAHTNHLMIALLPSGGLKLVADRLAKLVLVWKARFSTQSAGRLTYTAESISESLNLLFKHHHL